MREDQQAGMTCQIFEVLHVRGTLTGVFRGDKRTIIQSEDVRRSAGHGLCPRFSQTSGMSIPCTLHATSPRSSTHISTAFLSVCQDKEVTHLQIWIMVSEQS